jgi:hypothetical protein
MFGINIRDRLGFEQNCPENRIFKTIVQQAGFMMEANTTI